MKRDRVFSGSIFGVLSLVACAAAFVACGNNDATTSARAQGQVNLAIKSPDSDIQVVVRDGVATLTGTASGPDDRQRAEQAVKAVDGVSAIKDQITVPAILTGGTVERNAADHPGGAEEQGAPIHDQGGAPQQ